MINIKYLQELRDYMESGRMEEDFKWSAEERREEMLEFLEALMGVADIADQTATAIIFKDSQLGALLTHPAEQGKKE